MGKRWRKMVSVVPRACAVSGEGENETVGRMLLQSPGSTLCPWPKAEKQELVTEPRFFSLL